MIPEHEVMDMNQNEEHETPYPNNVDFESEAATQPSPQSAASAYPTPIANPLVRDPRASFGGVASGVAHRYGWDVALTRLAFVVLALATSGLGLIVYLLAWMIIPRAAFWPPTQMTPEGAASEQPRTPVESVSGG